MSAAITRTRSSRLLHAVTSANRPVALPSLRKTNSRLTEEVFADRAAAQRARIVGAIGRPFFPHVSCNGDAKSASSKSRMMSKASLGRRRSNSSSGEGTLLVQSRLSPWGYRRLYQARPSGLRATSLIVAAANW
jgi:hypothetical protein